MSGRLSLNRRSLSMRLFSIVSISMLLPRRARLYITPPVSGGALPSLLFFSAAYLRMLRCALTSLPLSDILVTGDDAVALSGVASWILSSKDSVSPFIIIFYSKSKSCRPPLVNRRDVWYNALDTAKYWFRGVVGRSAISLMRPLNKASAHRTDPTRQQHLTHSVRCCVFLSELPTFSPH